MREGPSITVEPLVRESQVRAYAERHNTKQPWAHVAGRLYALAEVSERLDELDEALEAMPITDELALVETAILDLRRMHRTASCELLNFFGEE